MSALSPLKVQSLNKRGRYADGRSLYLQVSVFGTKSWLFRYMLNGRSREMGLGSIEDVSLARARKLRDGHREVLKTQKIDPLELEHAQAAKRKDDEARKILF